MTNPFSLSFGKTPVSMINREMQTNEIIDAFTSDVPEYQVCMITGVRGSGKTVMLTSIGNELKKRKDWIVVDLNPDRDLLNMLAAELSNRKELLQIFKDAKINLSFLGFGLEIDGEPPITDTVVALGRMLERLTQKGRNVLVTIDEVTSNADIKAFVSQFQIFMRNNYNVFLLMTGLYENIYELQNEKTLTFLYRAPRVVMEPLSITMIANKYAEIFNLDTPKALDMARFTRGYSYAFQVLGYLCYKHSAEYEDVVPEFDGYMESYVYDKIWSELSGVDKNVVRAMAAASDTKVQTIRNEIGMSSNQFTIYRERLLRKGIVESSEYGHLDFTLPRFREFINRKGDL